MEITPKIVKDAGMQVSDQITLHVFSEEGDLYIFIIRKEHLINNCWLGEFITGTVS